MRPSILAAYMIVAVTAVGCSKDNPGTDGGSDAGLDLSTSATMDLRDPGDMSTIPAPPRVGDQFDRVGRPLVNLFMTNPFDLVPGKTVASVQDEYNAAATSSTWANFAPRPYLAENLAVWDGIDGTCGNQLLAGSGATRYSALAALLAQDTLLVDTNQQLCQTYLALERGVADQCGGRIPTASGTNNVVDVTLNFLQAVTPATALTNGVTSDPDGSPVMNFPFLLPPI